MSEKKELVALKVLPATRRMVRLIAVTEEKEMSQVVHDAIKSVFDAQASQPQRRKRRAARRASQ